MINVIPTSEHTWCLVCIHRWAYTTLDWASDRYDVTFNWYHIACNAEKVTCIYSLNGEYLLQILPSPYLILHLFTLWNDTIHIYTSFPTYTLRLTSYELSLSFRFLCFNLMQANDFGGLCMICQERAISHFTIWFSVGDTVLYFRGAVLDKRATGSIGILHLSLEYMSYIEARLPALVHWFSGSSCDIVQRIAWLGQLPVH